MTLRIATRRSKLALAQSHWVRERLLDTGLVDSVQIKEYVTKGDQIQNVPLAEVGGKGLFTKEIEDALLNGEADLAVHSLKDLPTDLPPGLTLGAIPTREDPRDALVLPGGRTSIESDPLRVLANGARIGTSSLRRQAQLLAARPDLQVSDVRGNVDTRLRKLDEGQYDALVLASAGLRRLGLDARITAYLAPEWMTPAPAQGALGIECREGDTSTLDALAPLNDSTAAACVTVERAVLAAVGGGCSLPLGAFAMLADGRFYLNTMLATPDGRNVLRANFNGISGDPHSIGKQAAEALYAQGGRELIASL